MNDSRDIFIVIPSFNESEIIRHTVETLLPQGYKIVVVDDASTIEVADYLRGYPVTVLRHPVNLGQGAALQTGMDYAFAHGAQAVIHFDADGQHDFREIPAFLAALSEGFDVVLGSRFMRSEDTALVPCKKRVMLQLARLVNLVLTGLWLTDAHNGFRALNRHALSCLHLHENRMAHATEILDRVRQNKLKVTEIPTAIHYTEYALQKGQKLTNSVNIVLDLLASKFL